MRALLVAAIAVLVLAAASQAQDWHPSAAWLAQAKCVHLREAPWNANTGNGYYGGMQIAPSTWQHVRGPAEAAFAHPGDPAFPFAVPPMAQLHVAWLIWVHDGRTWRSWGATGRGCALRAG
jgi:resuscitation-promoting factor RpfA